jgi:beta-glucosidase-like glycosyl hydrolase
VDTRVLAVGAVLLFAAAVVAVGAAIKPFRHTTDRDDWVAKTLSGMTVEQKVSQLFATHANGQFVNSDDPEYRRLIRLVEEFEIGSVVFFRGDPFTQAILTNDLQSRSRVPLLVAQDMEWGAGMRIEGTTIFPRAMAIGATGRPELAYEMGQVVAEEANVLGVHANFAPVADINNNPGNPVINVRSFGGTAELVSTMAGAFARGIQDGGLIAIAKHFPGHGDTATDSHIDLPVLPFSRSRLDSLELQPFRTLIDLGVGGVMVAHVALPEIDDATTPATLSSEVVTGILRQGLGFGGLIVSDHKV